MRHRITVTIKLDYSSMPKVLESLRKARRKTFSDWHIWETAVEVEHLDGNKQDIRWKLVDLVGMKIRGDWSGNVFDGRDVKRWLGIAHYGTEAEVAEMVRILGEAEA